MPDTPDTRDTRDGLSTPQIAGFSGLRTGLRRPDGRSIRAVAKTIQMRSARRKSEAKKAAAAKAGAPLQIPFLLNHGRAWINGNEVGGSDPRFAHLDRSYD
jgi:hypothetical protein